MTDQKIFISADEIQSVTCFKEFQETAINWYRTDEQAEIFTTDPTMITKLKNIMKRNPESYKCYYRPMNVDETGKPLAYTFVCNKDLISFRTPYLKDLSAEERMAMRDRLRKTN